jgi:hypothetical protein
MLTQLSTVRARLGLPALETQWDALLTATIKGVSARFDRLCNRGFARTVDSTFEFLAEDTEVLVPRYPVESVSKFETKENEGLGWAEHAGVDYLVRNGCVISLSTPLGGVSAIGRVTYTGGYVLPGTVPGAGQTALPADIEHAATEQVTAWFQNREKLGLIRHWPSSGTYVVLAQAPLLSSVVQILRPHMRWQI